MYFVVFAAASHHSLTHLKDYKSEILYALPQHHSFMYIFMFSSFYFAVRLNLLSECSYSVLTLSAMI